MSYIIVENYYSFFIRLETLRSSTRIRPIKHNCCVHAHKLSKAHCILQDDPFS